MAVFLILPTIGLSFPSLIPVAVAVAAGYGYKRLTETDSKGWMRGRLTHKIENMQRARVPVAEEVAEAVGEEVGRDQRLIFERDDRRLVFGRDERNKFFVEVLAPKDVPRRELERFAEDFARELVQEFVYNRVARELETRGLNVVEEEQNEETGDITLEVQRWR